MEIPIPLTREELVLRGRYETLSTANDLLIATWFLIGSILFFREATAYAGTWLFVIGSGQMMVRPVIRLSRRVHLQRLRTAHRLPATGTESDDDF